MTTRPCPVCDTDSENLGVGTFDGEKVTFYDCPRCRRVWRHVEETNQPTLGL